MIEIYFDDLKESKQKEVLAKVGVTDPADMNWDVFPICELEIDPEDGTAIDGDVNQPGLIDNEHYEK